MLSYFLLNWGLLSLHLYLILLNHWSSFIFWTSSKIFFFRFGTLLFITLSSPSSASCSSLIYLFGLSSSSGATLSSYCNIKWLSFCLCGSSSEWKKKLSSDWEIFCNLWSSKIFLLNFLVYIFCNLLILYPFIFSLCFTLLGFCPNCYCNPLNWKEMIQIQNSVESASISLWGLLF